MSLEEHSALIAQLKPLLMEPDFDEVFQQLTLDESNSTRFLVKMELNRLASPCTRIIDLRDKSELPCDEIRQGQLRHFLDAPAKSALLEAMSLFRDKYTLGVYEHVLQAHKERRQRQRQDKALDKSQADNFLVPGVVLGNYLYRCEQRMNYSIKISLQQGSQPAVAGVTLDLSVGGARIRLPNPVVVDASEPVRIKLLELGEEYYFQDLQQGIEYQIVELETDNDFSWMRLKRLGGSQALSDLLEQVILSYKLRYKVDINDVLLSTTGLGFERHYLPHLPHLPLFVAGSAPAPVLSHMLLSQDNSQLLHYFQDENNISQLPGMLTQPRLTALLAEPDNAEHSLFFCFTHLVQGKLFFYSASLAELKRQSRLALFLGFGSTKASWRVFKLMQHEISHQKGYKPAILPGDDNRYSPLVEQQLAGFSHVLQLMDLSSAAAQQHYQGWQYDTDANALKGFGQAKITDKPIKLVAMEFSERRQESRFAFKTKVKINLGQEEISGISQDISGRGLQIKLEKIPQLDKQDKQQVVLLNFPGLQSLAGKTDLSQMPYRLVRQRKRGQVLHLNAVMGHTPHVGIEFLNRLLAHNKDKLEQLVERHAEAKELADGMKNLLLRELHSLPYFVEKTVKSAKIACLGVGNPGARLSALFADAAATQSFNLGPLLRDGGFKRLLLEPIRQMKASDNMDFFEVFIQVSQPSSGRLHLKSVAACELGETRAQIDFIRQARTMGRFVALRVYRGATDKPDMQYIRRELEYIRVHASHRAKQLEQQLWHIIGVGELLDITQEVELRYPVLSS
ncbi:PilZ domain-containing protein [Shewanella salipaludis]|uniref:PilZ domain-containing protein n=1 Tax=Shewanella salipaludis TaxID=2723052 RepID=A0A972JJW9_9GAMM|nr:PilZ domain-containing protein [Shewanella salipaludis]NMH66563.1 PilZ domain-containing protein [Shewanella salipaludis]